MNTTQRLRWILKAAIFLACLAPIGLLLWDALTGNLTANPIEEITARTGRWTLRFLLITLAITPVRRLSGWGWLMRFRRMLGLFAFSYVALHFLTYFVLDQFFDLPMIIEDVLKRPYITVGFSAFVLLIPLAVTSTKKMIRRLGKRWSWLHRLIYLIASLGVVHYLWLVKSDIRYPATYGLVLLLLFVLRAWFAWAPTSWSRHSANLGARFGALLRGRLKIGKFGAG